ncbi:hypothetical protein A0H81_08721 [Grifola frondosa]|uniref:C3H1-type domain-containing protein n=1 Tax=Grifola frondosa TaxID=5627 RepID=A0A1C7M445_GRIFR|nr:hypothetical protein A0H81_08721 [Grifola frondosa]
MMTLTDATTIVLRNVLAHFSGIFSALQAHTFQGTKPSGSAIPLRIGQHNMHCTSGFSTYNHLLQAQSHYRQNMIAHPQFNPKYRTKPCRNFPTCKYGDQCAYLHTAQYPSLSSLSLSASFLASPTSPVQSSYEGHTGHGSYVDPGLSSHADSRTPNYCSSETSSALTDDGTASPDGCCYSERSLFFEDDGCNMSCPPPPSTPCSPNLSRSIDLRALSVTESSDSDGSLSSPESTLQRFTVRRNEPSNRNIYYKTKPCRFYNNGGYCVKGDRCNFIHDATMKSMSPKDIGSPKSFSDSDSEYILETTGSQEETPRRPIHDLPSKPVSETESNKKRNFFPITWRVVGGGVMMGGAREICADFMSGHCAEGDECRYAHPDSYDAVPCLTSTDLYSPTSPPMPNTPYYPFYGNISPVSATVSNPYITVPLVLACPVPEERRRARTRRRIKKTVISFEAQDDQEENPHFAHRIVDGNTLLEYDSAPSPNAQNWSQDRYLCGFSLRKCLDVLSVFLCQTLDTCI